VTSSTEVNSNLSALPELMPASNVFFQGARVMLIVLLMAAPLAFGAVEAWAWATISVLVTLAFLLWGIGCVRQGSIRLMPSPLYVPGLLVLLLAGLQLWLGWSMDRVATREAVIKLVTYLLIFFLGQHLFADASARAWRTTAVAVTGYMFLLALFATIQFFASPGLIYGVIQPRWGGFVFGPYVNHNNYAGLMELLIPIAVGLAFSLRPSHPARFFILFSIFIALASVFLSGARGGLIALIIECAIFVAAIFIANPIMERRNRLLIAGIGVVVLAGVFFSWLDPGDVWKRWEQVAHAPELALGERDRIVADSLRMSRDHLAFGVGVGAFEAAYPRYQTVVTNLAVDYAHDDYVQFFAEAGIVGWIVMPVSIAIFFFLSFGGMDSHPELDMGWLRVGAAAGVCGILMHSFSDFNLHIPANAGWFAFAAALAASRGLNATLS
jgi:O-antigen ligase